MSLLIDPQVERALSMFRTGQMIKTNFSETNWGQATASYQKPVSKVLGPKYLKIIKAAEEYNCKQSSRSTKAESSHYDERSAIVVSSDIEVDGSMTE